MLVIPAIDVRGGRCVRLQQGDYARETVFDGEPAAVAAAFIDAGARRLHVVDLDAARGAPAPASTAAVRSVIASASALGCEVQVGGGVRTVAIAEALLTDGAGFVVIGSVAVREPDVALAICKVAEGRVLLGLDVRGGRAQVQGWTESAADAELCLLSWREWPAAGVVYTDTVRDGMLTGPDLEGFDRCRSLYGGPTFLSGGVGDLADIHAAAAHGASGVIAGRALYEHRLDLVAALQVAQPAAP
jgi:phosphoribosylformimino-5-aminoimidazole carboxamide ribotide isomerase